MLLRRFSVSNYPLFNFFQAHMNARYVILQVLMEADSSLVNIENVTGDDGEPDLLIKMNREKIKTTGKEAIANFLMRLQVI